MNSIFFNLPDWWPWTVLVWLLLTVFLGWHFVRRPHPQLGKRTRRWLWILRSLAAAVLLLLVLNWSTEISRRTQETPTVHVLVDSSASMAVKDAPKAVSRFDYAGSLVQRIRSTLPRIKVETFSTNLEPVATSQSPNGQRSALGKSLSELLDQSSQEAIGGVVVLSDFAVSDEAELQEILQTYQTAGEPVYPWVIGTESQPPDVRFISARLTQPSPSQPSLRLEAVVESAGYAGKTTTLKVSFAEQVMATNEILLQDGRQTVTLNFLSPYRGLQFYDVELAALPGEASLENNRTRVPGNLRRDPIRVLYMEGSVPTEMTFLKNALERDMDMQVDCLHFPAPKVPRDMANNPTFVPEPVPLPGTDLRIFSDAQGRPVPSVCHPTRGFPTSMEKLLNYDVVILSDIIKSAFTPTQISNLVAFVEQYGGGFVMVGGNTSFGAGGWEKTPIDKIMPVEVANHNDPLNTGRLMVNLPPGQLHPLMRVGDTPEETEAAWSKYFPGFSGINYVRRAKPGALVLARTQLTDTNAAARPQRPGVVENPEQKLSADNLVLFAVQQIGRGRTMAFCSDTTEAWGKQFESHWGYKDQPDRYYARFWNNTIRWLAADRIAGKNGQTMLEVSSPQCASGDAVTVTLPATAASELSALELSVAETNRPIESLPLTWNNVRHCWESRWTAHSPGELRFEATYNNAEGNQVRLAAGVFVAAAANESVAVAARPALAAEIASQTGGKVLTDDTASDILKQISRNSVSVTWKHREPVWNTPWLLLLLLALVMTEWVIRRRVEPAIQG